MILTARTPHNWNIKTVNSCTIPLSPIHTVCACKSARWDARDGLVSRKWLQWILSGILGKWNWTKAAEDNVSHSLATWHNYQNWNLILRENIYQTKAFAICLREEMLNSRRAPSVSTSQSAKRLNASAMHEFEWKTDLKLWQLIDTTRQSDRNYLWMCFGNGDGEARREMKKIIIQQSTPSFYWTYKAAHNSEQLHIIYSLLSHRNEWNERSTGVEASAMHFQSRGQQWTSSTTTQTSGEEEMRKTCEFDAEQNRRAKKPACTMASVFCVGRLRLLRLLRLQQHRVESERKNENNLLLRIFIIAHTCARCAL